MCVCVTCHIVVLCIQAGTGRTTTLLPHLRGRWGWSCCSCQDDVVVVVVVFVEVVDVFGSVVPACTEGGGRGEDRGELRPLFISNTHARPYFHFTILPFIFSLAHLRHCTSTHTPGEENTLPPQTVTPERKREGGREGERRIKQHGGRWASFCRPPTRRNYW